MTAERERDAFRGALLGGFVGDALGRPVKGWNAARIAREHGQLRELRGHPPGRYTEDTQMAIVIAEWLLEGEAPDGASLARRIERAVDPDRDYGRTTTDFLRRLRSGESWQTAGEHVFARGSFGNGAAARVAPCVLYELADRQALERLVEASTVVTHSHPLALAGAILQARQIALALGRGGGPLEPLDLVVELRSSTSSREFRQKLRAVEECLERGASPRIVHDRLGSNATALGSVPTALYCALAEPDSFEDAVMFAVGLGGETDSLGAMTGAIAGAYHGASAIPQRWKSLLEEGPKGRSYVETLADRLLERRHQAAASRQRPTV